MKIAIALQRFVADGGTGRYATHLARGLAAAGHAVHVFCMQHEVEAARLPGGPGALVMHPISFVRLGSLSTMLRFAWAARRWFAALQPDVSLALGRIPGADVYRAGGGCHRSYLNTVSGWWLSPRHHVERYLDRAVVVGSRRVVANARLPRLQLLECYGADPGRVVVIPNGVDTHQFHPDPLLRQQVRAELGLHQADRVAVFLGAGFKRKGLHTAILTMARLPGWRLLVVGGDRGTGPYRRLADGNGAEFHFLGARRDPERVLAAADVMLLPTRYDSAANAVLEAMAAGVPAITSAANGAAEFLPEPWMTVQDPCDAAGYATALERCLASPGLGARCRQAAEQYTWERSREAMTTLLLEVAAEKRAQSEGRAL